VAWLPLAFGEGRGTLEAWLGCVGLLLGLGVWV
jgi:hypothetical protein